MNKAEVLTLVRLVKGICPAQQVDTYTPEAWALVIDDMSFEDAKAAVITLAKVKPFIALSDICTEVKRVRDNRIRCVDPALIGAGIDRDDIGQYVAAVKAQRKAIADGVPPAEVLGIEGYVPSDVPYADQLASARTNGGGW